ncbi:glycosyltransferase family 2 protein [Enterobacterales bacterium AW_CKDN230030176-1A_HGKHYDSX7]
MQTTDVLISVVIPAYNYAKVLPRAVTSVLAQLDVDCDLMVIDDGSTDETPEVLHQLSQQHPGRFRAVRKANGGLSSVRNLGIAETRGQYLIFLDADDEMAPGALEALRLHIRAHPTTRMVIGGHWSVFENGARALHTARPLPASPYARVRGYLIDKSVSLSNGACAMHRDVFVPGTYPEHLRNVEDIPVFAQVLARFECTIIDRPLAVIYKHHDSMRHDLKQSLAAGIEMVDEVFSPARLPASLHDLRQAFLTQRCLSLFRDCYGAGDYARAKRLYLQALRYDPCSVRRWSYTRKALRCLFK